LRHTHLSTGVLLAVACLGCGGERETAQRDAPIPTVPVPGTGPEKSAAASPELKFDGIRFTLPAGWKQVDVPPEKRGFIDAQVLVPAAGQELTLTLSSIGGGIEANVTRWKSQFSSGPSERPLIDAIDIGGRKATWVDLRGSFRASPGMAAESQSGWRMLGVGIPLEQRDFYLKLAGPAEAVEAAREEFREFVNTARLVP
jgi:hypothetical protein